MAKAKGPSLLEELKGLPQRSFAPSWPDKLPPAIKAEWEAIQAAYRSGEIACSARVIADRFFERFPDAPHIKSGHFAKLLRDK